MQASEIYFVVTPKGHVSESSVSFSEEMAQRKYVAQWLPEGVHLESHTAWSVWNSFENAGYTVKRLELPEDIQGANVCHT